MDSDGEIEIIHETPRSTAEKTGAGESQMMETEEMYRWEVTDIPLKKKDFPKFLKMEFTNLSKKHRIESNWNAELSWYKEGETSRIYIQLQQRQRNRNIIVPVVFEKLELEVRAKNRLGGDDIFKGKPMSIKRLIDGCKYNWNSIRLSEENMKIMACAEGALVLRFMVMKTAGESIDDDFLPAEINKEKFYRMVAKLENDEKFSDVKIVSCDGQEFFAHRWILSEVSDVFEAMFRSDMAEKETGVVKFPDLSGATVKLLLHFIYSERIGNNWSTTGIIEELVYAADKFQIVELKEFLDSNLGKACTAENAGALLSLAQKMSMEKADAEILAFIRDQCKDAQGFFDIVKRTKVD